MNEEMRKEFEEFIFNFLGVNVSENRGITPSRYDGYVFEDDDSTKLCTVAWFSWQASREAMKPINLPMWRVTSDGPSKYLLRYEVIEAIEQAGYKAE